MTPAATTRSSAPTGRLAGMISPCFRQGEVIVGRKGAYRGIHFSAKAPWVIDTAFYLNMRDPATVIRCRLLPVAHR